MEWQIYILKCSDGTFYTGITNNLISRIEKHNLGKGAKYTKTRLPVSLVYSEKAKDKSQSLKRRETICAYSRARYAAS